MSSSKSASLRPGWHKGSSGGRGFQPPPTVTERGDKSRSGSWGSQERSSSSNKFAVLDDEDGGMSGNGKPDDKSSNSRSEAFRSSFSRNSSTGTKPAGRSLADLAARVPETAASGRRHSGYEGGRAGGAGRFSHLRSDSDGDAYRPDPKVIRYTRERLLSMRTVPKGADEQLPALLKEMEGATVVSPTPQDPVCWDNFDGEEIWEAFRERRIAAGLAKADPVAGARAPEVATDARRRNAPSSGRWQRGVALPPPEEGGRRKSDHAENPNELWDDPIGGAIGAASDFSAFGAMPEDNEAFDFDKMAEASRKLEEELHGSRNSAEEESHLHASKAVDTSRPLASAGTTITSGSGDDVNVFEDFDAPSDPNGAPEAEQPKIRGADEDQTASSRLMKMIGVEPSAESKGADGAGSNPWGASAEPAEKKVAGIDPIFGSIGGLSLNPWGSAPAPQGGDIAGRLEALAAEQKAREQQVEIEKRAQQDAEMLRRRQEEENQRRAMAHRQAEEQARHQHAQAAAMQQQQQQQQQQASQQSQVELVLIERICAILEKSWGRSDLVSILTTLHSEDSRVIPLLSNVDALRALIARSPQRIALRREPGFSGDLAVLVLTNAQWQQQKQQQEAHARLQQDELRRRRMEEETRAQAQNAASLQMDPNLPWFYSDPQNNIQGPFRGEEMRQWLEAGYFKGDLPISQQPNGSFHPLSVWFPDFAVAFKATPARAPEPSPVKEETQAPAPAPQPEPAPQPAPEPVVETQPVPEAPKPTVPEPTKETKAAPAATTDNETSTQLKLMLGVSGAQAEKAPVVVEEAEPAPAPKAQSSKPSKSSKAQAKAPEPAPAPAPVETSSAPPKPAPAAWGGATNAKPKKSMSEIQQEEARAAAQQVSQMPRQSSSGWANVAAGSKGWSSGVVKKAAAGATAPAAPAVASGARPAQPRKVAPMQTSAPAPGKTKAVAGGAAGSSTLAEEFGATMSPALEKWCKEQMQRINGSDDLTLIAFCMSLTDANEIRQYITTYLGSSPQVMSFASEFISKRGLGSRQEEWETPGSAKKGRKKKQGR